MQARDTHPGRMQRQTLLASALQCMLVIHHSGSQHTKVYTIHVKVVPHTCVCPLNHITTMAVMWMKQTRPYHTAHHDSAWVAICVYEDSGLLVDHQMQCITWQTNDDAWTAHTYCPGPGCTQDDTILWVRYHKIHHIVAKSTNIMPHIQQPAYFHIDEHSHNCPPCLQNLSLHDALD